MLNLRCAAIVALLGALLVRPVSAQVRETKLPQSGTPGRVEKIEALLQAAQSREQFNGTIEPAAGLEPARAPLQEGCSTRRAALALSDKGGSSVTIRRRDGHGVACSHYTMPHHHHTHHHSRSSIS